MLDFIEYRGFSHVFQYSGPWLWWLLGLYLSLPILTYFVLPFLFSDGKYQGKKRVVSIFVLGDLGHSPRMCYHAISFSKLDYAINLCGYLESTPPLEVIDDVNIDILEIPNVKNSIGLPFILFAARKIILQVFHLVKLAFETRGSDYIMIQNPPSIPILAVLVLFIKLFSRKTRLIVDWHNLNYTVLNLRFNDWTHPLVKSLYHYEKFFGRFADLNMTVTEKLKEFLINDFGLEKKKIVTLYDRPAGQFKLFEKLGTLKDQLFKDIDLFESVEDPSSYKILVSSTSFTPDEDFEILLDALKIWDSSPLPLPRLLLIVTGKGPLKGQFLERVKELNFSKRIVVITGWLSTSEYPKVLAMADLGISLHTSSSGLDLPMKIVDFFGCGIPVISLGFPAIDELVKDGKNGMITGGKENSREIQAKRIEDSLEQFFTKEEVSKTLKLGALQESAWTWTDNWDRVLGRFFSYTDKNP